MKEESGNSKLQFIVRNDPQIRVAKTETLYTDPAYSSDQQKLQNMGSLYALAVDLEISETLSILLLLRDKKLRTNAS